MTTDVWEAYWKDQDNRDYWEQPAPEVLDLIRSLSSVERPQVLDLGCGLGRHAIAFALAQFSVTAIDASPTAIRHVKEWADRLKLAIATQVCDVFAESFTNDSFDVVVSYNVIYHGMRDRFASAIQRVRGLLKPGGLFFFTCPSRQDGKYGVGEQVAPHTYRCTTSVTPGDIHYFADEQDLDTLLVGFRTQARWKSEGYWDNRVERQFYSNWHVRAERI
ncbi:MAG: class I SAM-dependent methyltransferase [candidate division Zixibacteria bacterium]|nr:class I SAM-dependent methyltransferase [candidate division Zixibacteria bacterium]